ncbi:response regulator [Crocinitomix algicola]|uniref:response regulator n=1 Tax=Crocinitomix algicola TaxID=1740263 RepID=UPI00083224EC|nr:response regulator [Crocinitomix algicola]
MKKPFLFEFKISGAMVVVLILVSIIGFYTYQRYANVVDVVNDAVRPDMQLVTIKGLRNDLSDAENSIKSYSLTQDPVFMLHFDETFIGVNDKLNLLYDLREGHPENDTLVDTLSVLIDEKFGLLNELLSYQNKFEIEETMAKVSTEIEEVVTDSEKVITPANTQKEIDAEEKNKKRKWRIFNWNKKKEEENQTEKPNTDTDTLQKTVVTQELLTDVNKRLDDIKKEEIYISNKIIDKEIALILEDRILTNSIRTILDNMEIIEADKLAKRTENAQKEIEKANVQVVIFCIAIGFLLIFMAFTIINYVKNNNQYKRILAKAKIDAENLASAKARFMANMSHEIRTPMNAIAGFTEQLSQSPLNSVQQDQLEVVQKSTDHLLQLINEILDLSKLQNNKLKIEAKPFNPKILIEDVANLFTPKISQSNIALNTKLDKDLDQLLMGDDFRLRQILLNLVSNAVKFTEKGAVTIEAQLNPITPNQKELEIHIIDTGIGMSPEQMVRVFEEFEQAESSTARNYGGTGLGLSITKQLIELQKGSINVKSEENNGTEIIVKIPYTKGTEENQPEKKPAKETTPIYFQNLKILIADDEPFNRKLLEAIFRKENVELTSVSDGTEVLEKLKNNQYDCILMDMHMPEMDGIETTKNIRTNEKNKVNKNIPIIVLTAALTDEDKKRYIATGMNGIVAKPFNKKTVLEEISKVLKKQ